MKITKDKLKQIIKEEIANVLERVRPGDIQIPAFPDDFDDKADDAPDDAVKLACEDTKRGLSFRNELRAGAKDDIVKAQLMSKSKKRCPQIWAKDQKGN